MICKYYKVWESLKWKISIYKCVCQCLENSNFSQSRRYFIHEDTASLLLKCQIFAFSATPKFIARVYDSHSTSGTHMQVAVHRSSLHWDGYKRIQLALYIHEFCIKRVSHCGLKIFEALQRFQKALIFQALIPIFNPWSDV